MLFNSYVFIFLFLPVVLGGYILAGRYSTRAAMGWLVAASLFFYGWWKLVYLYLIVLSVVFNFIAGGYLYRNRSKPALSLFIAFNLGLLGYYKYAGFLNGIYADVTGSSFRLEAIVLPLAISFFTFQQITYLVDSYRRLTVRHGWLEYALFVTFFPQLIAGPIVHQAEILPQFVRGRCRLVARNLAIGITIFIVGLFKKVVIADYMGTLSTPMFDAAATGYTVTFLEGWGGALSYTFQLYFDFSGYSDMAIGLARMFGVRLPLNFNSPYKAVNIIEFWRCWHMTLSRFLRDYLYYPLGGNRKGTARRYFNLMVVMLLGGLWHGAGWTFVFWGGLHGFYLACAHLWGALRIRLGWSPAARTVLGRMVSWTVTFTVIVVGWVFFRAETWDAAINVLQGMAGMDGRLVVTIGYLPFLESFSALKGGVSLSTAPLLYFAGRSQIGVLGACLALVLILPNTQEWMQRYFPTTDSVKPAWDIPRLFLWRPSRAWVTFLIVMVGVTLVANMQPNEFLYFQF